ncbi:hypothetical protein [Candidatus Venteria ishoeyi]|uniref:Uncharacterized protein n=1 Tax=Candidatus Venteria ishoeyi TaxID=1899563 RepID=A0A1H6FFQ3_9GAMM|nr:hypothetical protein [Candidatus Venteria ishoeyi]SEH08473.1 Uncharacterised protein [Candidatus Venteria ishoeyi]
MMSSSFKKKLLPSAMAVAIASGALLSGNANAIHISADDKGQVLMAPIYMAEFGYNSKVTIVNTRNDAAVKVRIALRSQKYSDEFDFACLMTPSDVCRFEIVKDASGQAYLSSTDDSILASELRTTFASQCAGSDPGEFCKDGKLWVKVLDWDIRTDSNGVPIDNNEIGHLEVVGAWAAKGRILHPEGADLNNVADGSYPAGVVTVPVGSAMSKAELYKIMGPHMTRERLASYNPSNNESLTFATGRFVGGQCVNTPPMDGFVTGTPCYGVSAIDGSALEPASNIRSTDPSWIQLFGQVQLDNGQDRMGLQMTALTGDIWDSLPLSTHIPAYGMYSFQPSTTPLGSMYSFDGRLVSNPAFDFRFAAALQIGEKFGASRVGVGAVNAYDNIVEIENALAATRLMGSFESQYGDSSNVIVTFPTKYRHDSTDNFYREGTKAVGAEFPVASSLGDNNDVKDVCASELTASGGHTTGDGTPAAAGHLTGNPNLYELRNFILHLDRKVVFSMASRARISSLRKGCSRCCCLPDSPISFSSSRV